MSDCELIPTCPFFNDYFQDILEPNKYVKEEYCHDNYVLCGRYINFKKLEADRKRIEKSVAPVPGKKVSRKAQRVAHTMRSAI